jgi:hypothetical protein
MRAPYYPLGASLDLIPPIVDRVLHRLPNLFISSTQLLELSSHLRKVKGVLARMSQEGCPIADIHNACTREWTMFSNLMTPIVESDELQNVRAFCGTQLQLLERTVARIASAQETLTSKPALQQSFVSLEAAVNSVRNSLQIDYKNVQKTLKTLATEFQRSDPLLKLITTSESELTALKKSNLDFVEMMIQYVTNAGNGCAQRRTVNIFCQECFNEITAAFVQAEREESQRKALTARQNTVPQNGEEENRTRPVRKLGRIPEPRHIPVTRSKLFEDRRLVSARPARRSVPHSQSAMALVQPHQLSQEAHSDVE